jgi:hypothetical protein
MVDQDCPIQIMETTTSDGIWSQTMIVNSTRLRLAAGILLMAGTVALVGCGPDPVTRTTTTTERTMVMPPPPVSTTTTTTEHMLHMP